LHDQSPRWSSVLTYRGLLTSIVSRAGAGKLPPAAIVIAMVIVVAATIRGAAQAENNEISSRRAAQQTSFSDQEIKDGFFKTAFHAELQFDRPVDRIRKFDGAVRVFVVDGGAADRRAEIAAIVADIRAHVDHLDLAITNDRRVANFVVTLVRQRDLARTIRLHFGRHEAKQIQRSLRPQCLSGFAKDQNYRILRAEAILPVDAGDFTFHDCAYEELLQPLGLINDDSSVPWTMFNDEVQMGFFDVYDQYLVNILYDPRVRPGMTKDEVDKLWPDVLPTVRAWLADAAGAKRTPSNK